MWPGGVVPRLRAAKEPPKAPSSLAPTEAAVVEEQGRVVLRLMDPSNRARDAVIQSSALDAFLNEDEENASQDEILQGLRAKAMGKIPGIHLGHLKRRLKSQPVSISGDSMEEVEAVAKKCEALGLEPMLLRSPEGTLLLGGHQGKKERYTKPQELMVQEGKVTVPYLKPRTSLKPEERKKLRLAPSAPRLSALRETMAGGRGLMIDNEAAEKSRASKANSSLVKQAGSVAQDVCAVTGLTDDMPIMEGNGNASLLARSRLAAPSAQLRASLQALAQLGKPFANVTQEVDVLEDNEEGEAQATSTEVPTPPELALVHDQLPMTAASVATEFPTGSVPADRKMESDNAGGGAVRAMAVRIRGSSPTAYPFVQGLGGGQRPGQPLAGRLEAEPVDVQE